MMTTHVALLRAVNLPSHKQIAMSALCALLVDLRLDAPQSLLQSGNLVFGSKTRTCNQLEGLLQDAARLKLGLTTEFFVRTAAEWAKLVASNPFTDEAKHDPSHLVVMFLKEAPTGEDVLALQASIKGRETVRAVGRQAYVVYPDGIGKSRLTNAIIEKKLGTAATGRNWNTVLKLAAACATEGASRPSL